jgi:hypothetical protein
VTATPEIKFGVDANPSRPRARSIGVLRDAMDALVGRSTLARVCSFPPSSLPSRELVGIVLKRPLRKKVKKSIK